jgi:hypothetical protein
MPISQVGPAPPGRIAGLNPGLNPGREPIGSRLVQSPPPCRLLCNILQKSIRKLHIAPAQVARPKPNTMKILAFFVGMDAALA